MNRTLFYVGDVEVTPREIAVSVIILFVMLALGWIVTNAIRQSNHDKHTRLDVALQITDKDIYNHAINTKLGDIVAYGTMQGERPITNDRVAGQYSYLKEVEEHYVKKTRVVTYSCNCNSKGQCSTCTRTETYWEWDEYNTIEYTNNNVIFFDNIYSYNIFTNYPKNYIDTVKTERKIRFVYYGVPYQFPTSIIVNTSSGTIQAFDGGAIRLYPYNTPDEAISVDEFGGGFFIAIFWVIWLVVIGAAIYGYVYLENNYLY